MLPILPTMLRPAFARRNESRLQEIVVLPTSRSYGRVHTDADQTEEPPRPASDRRIRRVIASVASVIVAVTLCGFTIFVLTWWHLFSVNVGDRQIVSGNGPGRAKTFTVR